MKVMRCNKCNKSQNSGKFCLDCGQPLEEIITEEVKFKPIGTGRTSDQLKRDVRKWLIRIGVQQPNITINLSSEGASVEYTLKNNVYTLSSTMQKIPALNLAAVEQLIHFRVLGIERGIETADQAFAGYEALPDFTDEKNFNPYNALGFKEKVSEEEAIKKYKKLSKMWHPDVNDSPEASRQFQNIKKAIDLITKEN